MNPEVKALWVAALRSGTYTKTTKATARRYKNKYRLDVLGVLCMIHKETQPGALQFAKPAEFAANGALEYGGSEGLPKAVRKWAGLGTREIPEIKIARAPGWVSLWTGWNKTLQELNDEGWSFTKLADEIEKQL